MSATPAPQPVIREQQITSGAGGRILTNTGVWSPDSEWIVYDTRSDAAGDLFDGTRIERVHLRTGRVEVLYESRNDAGCGVVTHHPRQEMVVFILGPEHPTPDWSYGPSHRQGVVVEVQRPGIATNLDARDLVPPFTAGALRGGSHVHVWDSTGDWLSFTYNDALVEPAIRDVGVFVPAAALSVSQDHSRNHPGTGFSAVVTKTLANPKPGSDDIQRACEEGWVGTNGYLRADGSRQKRALAFQGQVITRDGETNTEVFIVDLPADLTQPGDAPLAGTGTSRPVPPKGVVQRRLSFTTGSKFPGIQGPRHWLRSSPDGSQIAFLMKDDAGIVQLWTLSPTGGMPRQLTRNPWPVSSAFTWSPDGASIAHAGDNSVMVTDTRTGESRRLTPRSVDEDAPRPEACVFAPDGLKIAFVRRLLSGDHRSNQICVLHLASRP